MKVMGKMTIHRALAELKLIDARIEKAIEAMEPTGLTQSGRLVNQVYKQEEFEESARAKFQSVNDLIERKTKIKSAIVRANGVTLVTINEKNMTIADAINFKYVVEYKKKLINTLEKRHRSMVAKMEMTNKQVEDNALKLAEAALQKDNVKISDGDAVAITGPYIEKNQFHLIDPLKVEELVGKLRDEVNAFESEVDAVLSEINAVTIIEV
jgi:molybdopterin converting factor small subunit